MIICDRTPAIVVGGASGLGLATAAKIAARGAPVAILDVNEEQGIAAAARIGALFVRADVTCGDNIAMALDQAAATHGVARLLVNCAGIAPVARTVDRNGTAHPLDLFRRTLEVNLLGSFNVASQFAARLLALEPLDEERGVIVNTASVAAFEGQIGQVAYAASKSGVAGMTLPLARDLAQHLIRVVAIAPGLFLTPMLLGLPEDAQASLGRQVPHPSRLGRPEEFSDLVESVISNPMLNGDVIRIDGAIRMGPR